MQIRDTYYGSNRPDQIRNGSIGGPGKPEDAGVARSARVEGSAPAGRDRVEISAAARAAAEDPQTRELGIARKALLGIPPLSQERAADILKRVQEGFYSQPEVVKQVADQVSAELTGQFAPQPPGQQG